MPAISAGHHRVDGREVRDSSKARPPHDAERRTLDHAARSPGLLPGIDRRERRGGDRQHVARALLEAADLAGRVPDRPAHLPADLAGDLGRLRDEGIDGAAEQRRALRERMVGPVPLRRPREVERAVNRGTVAQYSVDVHAAVDRAVSFTVASSAMGRSLR